MERAHGVELVAIREADVKVSNAILKLVGGNHLGLIAHSFARSKLAYNRCRRQVNLFCARHGNNRSDVIGIVVAYVTDVKNELAVLIGIDVDKYIASLPAATFPPSGRVVSGVCYPSRFRVPEACFSGILRSSVSPRKDPYIS